MPEYNRFFGTLSRTILQQHMTYLCVVEYHQIISQLPNWHSRISGPIPVAASLVKINQNKDVCQHNNNSRSDANSKSNSRQHRTLIHKTTMYGVQYVKTDFAQFTAVSK